MILFCSHFLNKNEIDIDFKQEYEAAKKAKFVTRLINYNVLITTKNAALSTKDIGIQSKMTIAVYRGWALTANLYKMLYNDLLKKNIKLINIPATYKKYHYLPEYYHLVDAYIPRSIWIAINKQTPIDFEKIIAKLHVFGTTSIVVKDYVSSAKHFWEEACFIKNAADINEVQRVTKNFIDYQSDSFVEGIVYQTYVALKELPNTIRYLYHTQHFTKEYRLFFFNKVLVGVYNYWREGNYDKEHIDIEPFLALVNTIDSLFFSIDIAQSATGKWIIIELDDGQVSHLPKAASPIDFYNQLAKYWFELAASDAVASQN